jgi:hypothetical protein
MDLLSTILELAGGPPPQRAQGRSFAPLITGQGAYQPRDAVMVQFDVMVFEEAVYGRSRALRTDRWTYGLMEIGQGSGDLQAKALFDLQEDPYQLDNLVNHPDYADTQSQLHDRLYQEMQALLDPLVVAPLPEIRLSITAIDRSVAKGFNAPDTEFTVTNLYVGTLNYTVTDDASWVSTTPDTGTCLPDEMDTLTIEFSTAGLEVGNYSATVSLQDPNAPNSPQEIAVSLEVRIPGDFDWDGDVDQSDFGILQTCFCTPGGLNRELCEDADFNHDLVVNQSDFAVFLECMGGANQPPGC